jgi:hypothetical protein
VPICGPAAAGSDDAGTSSRTAQRRDAGPERVASSDVAVTAAAETGIVGVDAGSVTGEIDSQPRCSCAPDAPRARQDNNAQERLRRRPGLLLSDGSVVAWTRRRARVRCVAAAGLALADGLSLSHNGAERVGRTCASGARPAGIRYFFM